MGRPMKEWPEGTLFGKNCPYREPGRDWYYVCTCKVKLDAGYGHNGRARCPRSIEQRPLIECDFAIEQMRKDGHDI